MSLVELREVTKSYPRTLRASAISTLLGRRVPRTDPSVLRQINLSIHEGEAIRLSGDNGSGKTTLLRILAGILSPTTGTVQLCDLVVPLLTPHAYFFDELPLRESLRFIAACFGMSPTEATESLHHFLGSLRLDEKAAFLTPGQRTQLLVHLALSSRAKLILLDEVVSRLDSMSLEVAAKGVQNYLARGSALVLVEHAQSYPWINREIHLSEGIVA